MHKPKLKCICIRIKVLITYKKKYFTNTKMPINILHIQRLLLVYINIFLDIHKEELSLSQVFFLTIICNLLICFLSKPTHIDRQIHIKLKNSIPNKINKKIKEKENSLESNIQASIKTLPRKILAIKYQQASYSS